VTPRHCRPIASFYGRGDELHMVFNFLPLHAPWTKAAWQDVIERVAQGLPTGAWPTWALSNHDVRRIRTRLGGEDAARSAAVLLLTQRGTPFVYQGDELGLEDAVVPDARRADPGGRDGCRAPLPWEPGRFHGWPTPSPWLPWPPDADARNAASARDDRESMLHLYRDLLALRRRSPALRRGSLHLRDAPDEVLAYERAWDGDRRLVLVNFGDREAEVPLEGSWAVDVASRPQPEPGVVPAHGAGVLEPERCTSTAGRRAGVSLAKCSVDSRARLQRICGLEGRERVGAAAASEQGIAEVVIAVRLVGICRPGYRKITDRLAQRRDRGGVVRTPD